MRSHDADNYWRRTYRRDYEWRIKEVQFENIAGFGDGKVEFGHGLTAICGANGVGKTTLLEATRAGIDHTIDKGSRFKNRLANARLTVRLEGHDGEKILISSFDKDGQPDNTFDDLIPISVINPAMESVSQIQRFVSTTNLSELLEGYATADLTDRETEEVSFVVGKNYSRVSVTELDDLEEGEIIPYFNVTTEGISYGSESMGLGELALHLTLWRIRRLVANSILLIEEPESHISPRSQRALMNVVAAASSERGIWTLITTHSAATLERIPSNHIKLVSRLNGELVILANASQPQLEMVTGIAVPIQGVLLVEDRGARELTKLLIAKYAPDLLRVFEVRDAGQEGIHRATNDFPEVGEWLSIVGIYDGDMRDSISTARWPVIFLPGNSGPERLLRGKSNEIVVALALASGQTKGEVRFLLGEIDTIEDHDWFEECARGLNINPLSLMNALLGVWLSDEGNAQSANIFIEELRSAIELSRKRPLTST